MKIIIVGTAYPYRGGLSAFNERLAREFQSEGHEVEIFTFKLQYPSFLFPGKTQFTKDPAPKGLKIHRTMNSINPFSWLKTARKIKKKKPDLIIYAYWMSFMAPCFGAIARFARTKGTKQLALVHNMTPHEPSLLDKLLPFYFVRKMDAFVAMADAVMNDIERFDKKRKPKTVSPHPIYDDYGQLLSRKDAAELLHLSQEVNYMLFFGLIRQYKGLDLLLAAFADRRLQSLPLQLLVAGEFYGNEEIYLKKIKDLGLEERVVLHSYFIPNNEVRRYFSLADIVVQPYRTATQSGVSQIAYHFDKPMLVSNVGGLAEIVPHGKVGYVVEPKSEAIADALVDFFTNRRSAEFIENIATEKKKYAWSCMTKAIIDLSSQSNL